MPPSSACFWDIYSSHGLEDVYWGLNNIGYVLGRKDNCLRTSLDRLNARRGDSAKHFPNFSASLANKRLKSWMLGGKVGVKWIEDRQEESLTRLCAWPDGRRASTQRKPRPPEAVLNLTEPP